MVDPSSKPDGVTTAIPTVYSYDSRNRLLEKATPQGILIYTYDNDGNVTSILTKNPDGTDRTGASVTYTWNALNQLATVTDNRLNVGVRTTLYQYDRNGNPMGCIGVANGLHWCNGCIGVESQHSTND